MEEKIKEIILKELECEAIVLFGSYARGTQNSESDINIAIKPKNKIDKKSDSFRYEILITGKTLYCEDTFKFEMYKLDMYKEYLELNESRQMIINRIKNGGDIYGKRSSSN